jgi:hypothetical protein
VYAKRSALDIINCKLHWHDKTSYVSFFQMGMHA